LRQKSQPLKSGALWAPLESYSFCPLIAAMLAIPMDHTPIAGGSVLSTPQQAYREQQAIEEIAPERLADLTQLSQT
jgi:hypothetical protein